MGCFSSFPHHHISKPSSWLLFVSEVIFVAKYSLADLLPFLINNCARTRIRWAYFSDSYRGGDSGYLSFFARSSCVIISIPTIDRWFWTLTPFLHCDMDLHKEFLKMTHWHDLPWQTIKAILIRLAVIFLATDLCCLRWDLITTDTNSGLITLPFVDIHITTSSAVPISSYSLCFAAPSVKAWLPTSTPCSSQAPISN